MLTDSIELKDGETALFAFSTRDERKLKEHERIYHKYDPQESRNPIPFRVFQQDLIEAFGYNPLSRMDLDLSSREDRLNIILQCIDTIYRVQDDSVTRLYR